MDSLNLKVCVETSGCKVNTYDTGLLQKHLLEEGFVISSQESQPDIFVLNTCAVTAEATKESLRRVRRIKKDFPNSQVVVTGCSAQVDAEIFQKEDMFDLLIDNSHKSDLARIIKRYISGEDRRKRIFQSNIFKQSDLGFGGGEEIHHTRSFLKIQDGCNSFCTFCVIPFARGKSRSFPINTLIQKIGDLSDKKVKEVVLTGVHIGDYCDESRTANNKLEDLVEEILLKTSISRLRLSSLEPVELSQRLISLYSEKRLCPHFHMSIQSANTEVLRAMKRQYTASDVERSLNAIEKNISQAFVGMDLIAGFPGETQAQFKDSYSRLENLPWTKIHVFPYSPRPKVYANKIESQVHRSEILKRASQFRKLSDQRFSEKAMEQMGLIKKALVLNSGTKALSRDYWSLTLESPQPVGSEILCKVKGCARDRDKLRVIGLRGAVAI